MVLLRGNGGHSAHVTALEERVGKRVKPRLLYGYVWVPVGWVRLLLCIQYFSEFRETTRLDGEAAAALAQGNGLLRPNSQCRSQ